MLAGCVFLLTAIVAMPTGDSSGRLAQLEPAPLEKASPSRPELKAAKREVKLHLYDRNVWSMSANSNMLLAMTLGGKLRILADFLLDSAGTGVPIDEQTLAYANHVRGLTDAQILDEAHTDAVKTTFAEGMLLMTTDEGEERGLTFTEEDIDRLSGTYHYSGGGDGADRLDLGAAVSPPPPVRRRRRKASKPRRPSSTQTSRAQPSSGTLSWASMGLLRCPTASTRISTMGKAALNSNARASLPTLIRLA